MEPGDLLLRLDSGKGLPWSVHGESLAGSAEGHFTPPLPLEQIESTLSAWRRVAPARRGAHPHTNLPHADLRGAFRPAASATGPTLRPVELARELDAALFHGPIRDLYFKTLAQCPASSQPGLRLFLRASGAAATLPWELLPLPERATAPMSGCLASRLRHLPLPVTRPAVPPLPETLRILLVLAAPEDQPTLNLALEEALLRRVWRGFSGLEIETLGRADRATLRAALLAKPCHVLHIIGHGDFDEASQRGHLFFTGDDGSAEAVSGDALAGELTAASELRLVVLNACSSGRVAAANAADPFAGVATALLAAGIAAVVAMQFPITDRAAIAFSQALYRRLAAGAPLDRAVAEGRLAIRRGDERSYEWATPVLYLHGNDPRLFLAPPRPRLRRRQLLRLGLGLTSLLAIGVMAAAWPRISWGLSCAPLPRPSSGHVRIALYNHESAASLPASFGDLRRNLLRHLESVPRLEVLLPDDSVDRARLARCVDATIEAVAEQAGEQPRLTAIVQRRSEPRSRLVDARGPYDLGGSPLDSVTGTLARRLIAELGSLVPPESGESLRAAPWSLPAAVERNNSANLAWQNGNLEAAESSFRAAIELDPRFPSPRYNLGRLLLERGDLAGALVLLRSAVESAPRDAEYRFGLADALDLAGELDEAEAAYVTTLALDPTLARAMNNLGNLYRRQGKYALARTTLDRARGFIDRFGTSSTPTASGALLASRLEKNLGRLALDEGHPDKAARHFDRALLEDSRFTEAACWRIVALHRLERSSDADAALERLRELRPSALDPRADSDACEPTLPGASK